MPRRPIKTVLLIEDNPGDARLLREMLNERVQHRTELSYATTMREAETQLAERAFDIILLDLGLPDAEGLEAVRRTHSAAPHTALVVLTGLDDESLAAQVVQEGAQDHLIKGQIETRGLLRAMGYAIERKTMEEKLFAEKERAMVTLNSIGDAVMSRRHRPADDRVVSRCRRGEPQGYPGSNEAGAAKEPACASAVELRPGAARWA